MSEKLPTIWLTNGTKVAPILETAAQIPILVFLESVGKTSLE